MAKSLELLRTHRSTSGETPSEQVARIGWILLKLLHDRAIDYRHYCDRFGRSTREFQRDLCKLRAIGQGYFTVSRMRNGRALLATMNGHFSALPARRSDVHGTLARIAAALGGPIEREIRQEIGDAASSPSVGFLHLREPVPKEPAAVTQVFQFLKAAAESNARIEFSYMSRGRRAIRRAEPYHVVCRTGRYYLVSYDLVRRDWRLFALDSIESGTLRRDGTFAPQVVPGRFLAQRAVGWISGSAPTNVTIRVSRTVAAAVRAKQWQKEELVAAQADGSIEIVLTFEDLSEAVRWTLQYGAEAVILAPPQAVALAQETVRRIAQVYGELRQRSVATAL